jgi:hypothetical protein
MITRITKQLKRIRIRKGLNEHRKQVVFEEGEPVYTIDTKKVYIGDNASYGGILISHANTVENELPTTVNSLYGDIIYNLKDKKTYITYKSEYTPMMGTPTNFDDILTEKLDYIEITLNRLTNECCIPNIVTDNLQDILTDFGTTISI